MLKIKPNQNKISLFLASIVMNLSEISLFHSFTMFIMFLFLYDIFKLLFVTIYGQINQNLKGIISYQPKVIDFQFSMI